MRSPEDPRLQTVCWRAGWIIICVCVQKVARSHIFENEVCVQHKLVTVIKFVLCCVGNKSNFLIFFSQTKPPHILHILRCSFWDSNVFRDRHLCDLSHLLLSLLPIVISLPLLHILLHQFALLFERNLPSASCHKQPPPHFWTWRNFANANVHGHGQALLKM